MHKIPFGSAIILLLGITSTLSAQRQGEPPAVRPEDFSELVGSYQITSQARPTEVCVEDPVALTVRITGQGPRPFQPARKNLHLFPPHMSDDFYIEPLPGRDRYIEREKAWELYYHLRPKRQDV